MDSLLRKNDKKPTKRAVYFYPDKGAKNNGIDGYYGPKTANAVKRFQLMHGLAADGIYGPKTKAKLEKLLK